MATNTILTPTMITKETSRILAHSLAFANSIKMRYDDRFANRKMKIGDSFSIRIPPRYIVTDGVAMPANVQSSDETSRTLKIDYKHVALEFSDSDLLLDVNSFADQFLNSAVAALANKIDFVGAQLYYEVPQLVASNDAAEVGVGVPTDFDTYLHADALLTQAGVPRDRNRIVCINSQFNRKIIGELKELYNPQADISRQFKRARMKEAAGLMWVEDENMILHTNGTRTAAGAVNDNVSAGDKVISIDDLGADTTVKKGDVFTIADVFAVNPQSRQSTMRLQRFTVLEDKTVSSGGAADGLKIFPAIYWEGKDQTVSARPANDAVVTFSGGPSAKGFQCLAYHTDAFALAMVDDQLPNNVEFSAKTKTIDAQEWGVMVSVIRDYEIRPHEYPCRVGSYFGWKTARPEMAVRITS